jgi:hypothetical protein
MKECSGTITDDLETRRKTRVPCQCVDAGDPGFNPLISNRADQVFSFDPHLKSELGSEQETNNRGVNLPERRPDRVYGFCQTPIFEKRLRSPAGAFLDEAAEDTITALMKTVDTSGEELLVRDFIQATPYHQRGDPLLFPFLILEAKSEDGRGHRNSAIQTSLPVWALLKAQERLERLSESAHDLEEMRALGVVCPLSGRQLASLRVLYCCREGAKEICKFVNAASTIYSNYQ